MHTLFALEDLYGLKVELVEGEAVLRVDSKGTTHPDTAELVSTWAEQAAKYRTGEITKDEYDKWRYNYPKYDTTGHWHKVPSQELSDAMVERLYSCLPAFASGTPAPSPELNALSKNLSCTFACAGPASP